METIINGVPDSWGKSTEPVFLAVTVNPIYSPRGELRLLVRQLLQEGGVHQERQPQLVCQREDLCQPESTSVPGQQQQCPGQGEQGFRAPQAGDHHPQRREAPQGCEGAPQQEDCPLLRAGPHWHHWGHQAGDRGGQKALHLGWQAGRRFYRCDVFFFLSPRGFADSERFLRP